MDIIKRFSMNNYYLCRRFFDKMAMNNLGKTYLYNLRMINNNLLVNPIILLERERERERERCADVSKYMYTHPTRAI